MTLAKLARRASCERAAGSREDQALHFADARRRAGTGEWRCARCRPGSSATPARSTAAITTSPAATSTSLFASAMCFAMLDGFVGGGKADDADGGGNDDLRVGMSGDPFDSLRSEQNFRQIEFSSRRDLASGRKARARAASVPTETSFGAILATLLGGESDIRAGSESDDLKLARMRLDNLQTLAANRAGGT